MTSSTNTVQGEMRRFAGEFHDSTVWRFIPPLAVSGAMQMALDEWLLEQHLNQSHPPTLRFYTWSRPTISLGFHQQKFPDEWRSLRWRGQPVDLVRRPSGGRAVLHHGDLTYAIVLSGLASNRMAAYREICQFLIDGWRSLGISLNYGIEQRGYIHNPNCFGTATAADLVTSEGVKLIGSAQLRRRSAILQHGSMQLQPNPDLFEQIFSQPFGHTPIPQLPIQAIIDALTHAAQQRFAVELLEQPLSHDEWEIITQRSSAFIVQ